MSDRVLGLDELIDDLNRLNDRLGDEAIEDVLLSGGYVFEGAAKPLTPVDTGFLRASIYTSSPRVNGYAAALAAARSFNPDGEALPPAQPERLQVVVAVAAEYGAPVEYGTSRMAARPFLRPAFDANRNRVADLMGRLLVERMEEALR